VVTTSGSISGVIATAAAMAKTRACGHSPRSNPVMGLVEPA
jgi:hypothetical protein